MARYRDYDTDIDARELAIKLLEKYADIPNEFTCDEYFDDFISDFLQYGTECITGVIAVLYQHIWAMADLRERLKGYEDLEERGKLLKLPCAVGDMVYRIEEADCENCLEERPEIYGKCTYKIGEFCGYEEIIGTIFDLDMFSKIGETVFSTHEEAEAALKKIEEKKV